MEKALSGGTGNDAEWFRLCMSIWICNNRSIPRFIVIYYYTGIQGVMTNQTSWGNPIIINSDVRVGDRFMQRDMDLARTILFEIEKIPYDMGTHEINIDGYSKDEVNYHIILLNEAGLIEAIDLSSFSGSAWKSKRLTWKGHEFLDASRSDNIWNKAKHLVASKGLSVSFDIFYKLLIRLVSAELN